MIADTNSVARAMRDLAAWRTNEVCVGRTRAPDGGLAELLGWAEEVAPGMLAVTWDPQADNGVGAWSIKRRNFR